MSWLDSATVHRVLETMRALANANKGAQSKQTPKVAEPKAATESGLASQLSVGAFAHAAKRLESEKHWRQLNPKERADQLVEAANVQLQAAGVRPTNAKFSSEVDASNPGKFDATSWTMLLDRQFFSTKKRPRKGRA